MLSRNLCDVYEIIRNRVICVSAAEAEIGVIVSDKFDAVNTQESPLRAVAATIRTIRRCQRRESLAREVIYAHKHRTLRSSSVRIHAVGGEYGERSLDVLDFHAKTFAVALSDVSLVA